MKASMKHVRARKPERPDRPDPLDPPSPPGREFQDPWFPDLAIHLYGSNWNFEIGSGDNVSTLVLKAEVRDALKVAIGGALSAFLPAAAVPDIQFAFDDHYPGTATSVCLSIGLWSTPLTNPNDPDALVARRNGMLRLRRSGQRAGHGELMLRFSLIDAFLRRILIGLPGGLPTGTPQVTINAVAIVPVGPSSLRVSVFVSTSVPVLGSLHHLVELTVEFGARRGDLTIGASNLLVSGDFLIGTLDASAVLPFIVPRIGQFSPRIVFMRDLKLSLAYASPVIERRGQGPFISGQQVLVVPVTWDIGARAPAVRVSGPRSVRLAGSHMTVRYNATTTDMFSPTFTWKLNGRVQVGLSGPSVGFIYRVGTQQPGALKTYRVEVVATEAASPHLERSTSMTTAVRVVEIDI